MAPDIDLGVVLPAIARAAIGSELGIATQKVDDAPALKRVAATFVTLRRDGELRGCIGSLKPKRTLGRDVRANAIAAAFHDPRFPPLAHPEFDAIAIEVSLLGPHEPLLFATETEALLGLRPGLDGVVLECGPHRATFLPQVWDQLPHPCEFLAALKRKAGLAEDFWSAQVTLARYSVTKFGEMAGGAA